MSDAVVAALFAALVWKFTDFLKHVRAGDVSAALTQLVAWAAAFVTIILFAHSQFAPHLMIHGIRLDKASWPDQLLLGLAVGSLGSGTYDIKRALDNNDSAVTPPLVKPPS